nr:hypothetical protein [Tanacetum cinerariifolium]
MDLFAFIRHSDPTKVRIGKRELTEHEVGLLKMTEGHTVPLNPPTTTASEDCGDSIDKLFDDVDQEHVVEKSDDVLEETIAKDASTAVAEKARKKRKRKVVGDASGSTYPPKKLRDDHQSLLPNTVGKSFSALRDVGPLDSVFGPNVRACPPYVMYVVSSDGSRHSGSYSETNSLVKSPAADAPVVTVVVTTTVDVDVAAGSKAKDVSKDFVNIVDSTSAGGMEVTNDSTLDDLYVCRDLTDRLAPPALFAQLRAMDYDQLYSEFNIGAAQQVCLRAEVRMRAEHTLERKGELEEKCAEHTTLLSEKDAEIAHLKSLLSLKETEAAEAISLQSQLSVMETADAAKSTELRDLKERNFSFERERSSLSEKVTNLESVTTSKEAELASLCSQVAKHTADLSGIRSLSESTFELFKERIEALLDEQAKALGDRVVELDAQLSKMAALGWAIGCAINKEAKYVDVVNTLGAVDFSLLSELESKKDSSIVDLMDSLCLEGALAEIPGAKYLMPSPTQLMLLIHRPEENVVFAETSLSFSLEIVDLRVQSFREEAKEKLYTYGCHDSFC